MIRVSCICPVIITSNKCSIKRHISSSLIRCLPVHCPAFRVTTNSSGRFMCYCTIIICKFCLCWICDNKCSSFIRICIIFFRCNFKSKFINTILINCSSYCINLSRNISCFRNISFNSCPIISSSIMTLCAAISSLGDPVFPPIDPEVLESDILERKIHQ